MGTDRAWISGIRSSRELTYFNGANVGKWAGIVDQAVAAFNKMPDSTVTYKKTKEKASANVVLGVTDGVASFPYGGNNEPIMLEKHRVHGKTRVFAFDSGIEKAAIFLPSAPSEDHKNYLIFIVAHELAHACGLEDHQNDGLLLSPPNMFNGKIFASADSKKMPPLFLGAKAAGRMQAIW